MIILLDASQKNYGGMQVTWSIIRIYYDLGTYLVFLQFFP